MDCGLVNSRKDAKTQRSASKVSVFRSVNFGGRAKSRPSELWDSSLRISGMRNNKITQRRKDAEERE